MVNGAAAGLGLGIALACDFRFVTKSSRMTAGFVNIGLPGDTSILYSLQMMIGTAKTMEWMMTGDILDGEQAYNLGAASHLVPEGQLESATMEFAKMIASKPLLAMRCQKKLMYETFWDKVDIYNDHESDYMTVCSQSQDFREAVDAFLEKRKPTFTGK